MTNNYYLLDTFTDERFGGNPTAVCILDKVLSLQNMHALAKEFNSPVTAFIEPKIEDEIYPIRYFTITGEISACGHATLGAAFVLLSKASAEKIIFETIEQIRLKAWVNANNIFIEYPKFQREEFEIATTLKDALGISNITTSFFCHELQSLFIEMRNEEELRHISPDYKLLTESTNKIKEVVIMSKSENQNYDFVLRSFCPWIGINEDPVTGSIHSVLGQFWKEKLGKDQLVVFQASERGGKLLVNVLENVVEIGGSSKIIIQGRLAI